MEKRWWKLLIRTGFDEYVEKYILVENKWDLFAYIGYLYSNWFCGIKRIDYKQVSEDQVDMDQTLSEFVKSRCLSEIS